MVTNKHYSTKLTDQDVKLFVFSDLRETIRKVYPMALLHIV